MTHQFQYQPLDSPEQDIRLVELRISQQDASLPLELRLRHVKLRDNPKYWALSYTWGAPFDSLPPEWDDPTATRLAKVNGKDFHVRWNLDAALRRLSEYSIPALWIDVICIDQSNIPEKNSQVQNMRHIYKHARTTFAWLGPDWLDSCETTGAISSWMNSWVNRSDQLRRYHVAPEDMEEYWSFVRLGLEYDDVVQDLRAMAQLLGRRWFHRVWIIQEVVLSREVVLLWGEEGLTCWDWLESVVSLLAQHHCSFLSCPDLKGERSLLLQSMVDVLSSATFMRRICDLRKCFRQSITANPVLVLDAMRTFKASDPKDHVFGGFGMVPDYTGVTVDYNQTTADVFKTITRTLLERDKDLSILALCRPSNMEDLPSWAVDFTGDTVSAPLGSHRMIYPTERLYNAGGSLPPRLQFRGDSTLEVSGLPIGVVTFVGDPEAGRRVYGGSEIRAADLIRENGQIVPPDGFMNFKALHEAWLGAWIDKEIQTGMPEQDFESNYIWTGEPLWKALYHTVCADTIKSSDKIDPDRRLSSSFGFTREDLNALTATTLPDVLHGRTFAVTSLWQFCLVPDDAMVGDVVFVAIGAETPFILRSAGRGRYKFRGYAYAHGLMDGKALNFSEMTRGHVQGVPFIII